MTESHKIHEESQPDGQPLAETQTVIDPPSVSSLPLLDFSVRILPLISNKNH